MSSFRFTQSEEPIVIEAIERAVREWTAEAADYRREDLHHLRNVLNRLKLFRFRRRQQEEQQC